MRIVAIREAAVPIASAIRNAYIDFSHMTASIVAVITDVVRDGKPVVGFGFNSNGRYDQSCLLRTRFIPRLMSRCHTLCGSRLSRSGSMSDAGSALMSRGMKRVRRRQLWS